MVTVSTEEDVIIYLEIILLQETLLLYDVRVTFNQKRLKLKDYLWTSVRKKFVISTISIVPFRSQTLRLQIDERLYMQSLNSIGHVTIS